MGEGVGERWAGRVCRSWSVLRWAEKHTTAGGTAPPESQTISISLTKGSSCLACGPLRATRACDARPQHSRPGQPAARSTRFGRLAFLCPRRAALPQVSRPHSSFRPAGCAQPSRTIVPSDAPTCSTLSLRVAPPRALDSVAAQARSASPGHRAAAGWRAAPFFLRAGRGGRAAPYFATCRDTPTGGALALACCRTPRRTLLCAV